MEHESDGDTNCNWLARNSHQRIGIRTEEIENKRMSGEHPNYSIVENTRKNSGDLWRHAVSQTPLENHQLTLV